MGAFSFSAEARRRLTSLGASQRRPGGITRVELSARSGVCLAAIQRMTRSDQQSFNQPILTLVRVAVALGCAPVELMPSLGMRPRTGLL